jgi:ketosteroid isomerase-like protein
MVETPYTVVQAFVAAINARDAQALRALMTEDHTFTDARGNSFSGADKMLSGWLHFFHDYPDYRISIQRSFAEGNWAALFGEATGKWRVKEQILSATWKVAAAWLAEIEAGKIKNWSVFCDTNWVNPPQ